MKKRMIAAAIAAMFALSAGTALANPVELSGFVSLQQRKDITTNTADLSAAKLTFVVNAKTNVTKNLDFYARLGVQAISDSTTAFQDYNTNVHTGDHAAAFDQFGFLYNNAGFNYKLGRQDVTIGATALLYNNNSYVGKKQFNDGLTISGKSGVTTLKAIAVRNDDDTKAKMYVLNGSYNPAKNWTLGGTLAKYTPFTGSSTNYWAVNAGYDINKVSVVGEYAKSNVATSNKAYDLGVTYNADDKNSIYVTAFSVETNGNINTKTDFFNNEKGYIYGYNYKLNKDTTLGVSYKDGKNIDTNAKSTSLRTTISYSF